MSGGSRSRSRRSASPRCPAGPAGALQQGEQAAGGEIGVEAGLLDGGADDEAAVALGRHVDLLGPDDVVDAAAARGDGERHRLPLERADRQGEVGQQAALSGPGPRGDDRGGGPHRAGARAQADDPAALAFQRLDGAALDQPSSRRPQGDPQGRHHPGRIDLMVVGAEQPGGHGRAQARLAGAHRGAGQPLDREAVAALEVVAEAQALDLVAAERDDQRTLAAVVDGQAGGRFEVVAERVPEALAREAERQQRLAAGARARPPPPASRSPRGWRRRRPAALDHRDGEARRRQPPRDRQADQPGPDDRDVGALGQPVAGGRRRLGDAATAEGRWGFDAQPRLHGGPSRSELRLPAVKAPVSRTPSNPYAGMSRIRFEGFPAPTCRPVTTVQRCLSPLPGISLERTVIWASMGAPSTGEGHRVGDCPGVARRATLDGGAKSVPRSGFEGTNVRSNTERSESQVSGRERRRLRSAVNQTCRGGRSPCPRRSRRGGGCRAARDRPTGSRRRASTSAAARSGSC